MRQLLILALAPIAAAAAAPPRSVLDIEIQRVRNSRGVIHACLTAITRHFPDCKGDPNAIKLTIPARTNRMRMSDFAPGRYALTLFHDENNNGRLDTIVGIPREGFGFSRNPVVRFGAPKFSQVGIELGSGFTRYSVQMQYLL